VNLVSVLGLLFAFFAAVAAGIAARAAVKTVSLTIQYRHDEQVRRLAEALVALRRIAEQMPGYADPRNRPRSQAFDDAQLELERAAAVPMFAANEAVEDLLSADAWRAPKAAARCANDAYLALVTQPPPSPMPRWYLRLVTYGPRRRARRP
jgi:hypothetical protein